MFVNKFVLKIGLISYSLYLLHYPIFAFVRANRLAHSNIDYLFVALIIFVLSYISYRFIEKPFRNSDFIKDKSFLKILVGLIIFLCSFSLFIIGNKGFEYRYPNLSNFSLDYEKYRKELTSIDKYNFSIETNFYKFTRDSIKSDYDYLILADYEDTMIFREGKFKVELGDFYDEMNKLDHESKYNTFSNTMGYCLD